MYHEVSSVSSVSHWWKCCLYTSLRLSFTQFIGPFVLVGTNQDPRYCCQTSRSDLWEPLYLPHFVVIGHPVLFMVKMENFGSLMVRVLSKQIKARCALFSVGQSPDCHLQPGWARILFLQPKASALRQY